MRRRGRGAVVLGLVVAWAVPGAAGCGGGGEASSASAQSDQSKGPPKKKAAGGRPGAGRGKTKIQGGKLDTYGQIQERFRLAFGERDFQSDPGGDENRDPFRSYVIRQGTGPRDLRGAVPIQPTDVCTERNSRAPGHSIRELRLIGLVLRGTRSYAQFRDPSGFGWIVRLRDCLGKEKAMVEKIGAGFVTLEVMPEAAATGQPQAERRDIQLHPAELRAEEGAPPLEAPREVPPLPVPGTQASASQP